MRKKSLLALLMVCCLLASVGCSASTDAPVEDAPAVEAESSTEVEAVSEQQVYKVGVCMPDNKVAFFSRLQAGMESVEQELGLDFTFVDADNDTNTQMGQIDTFVSQQMDMIVILATQVDALIPSAKTVNEAGIPVLTINRKLCSGTFEEAGVDCITYVGADDYEGGRKQGELVVQMLGDSGNIALLQSTLGASHTILRQQGLEDYLAENAPNIKIIDYQTSNQDQNTAMTVTENWLTRYQPGEIDGFVCQDGDPTLGIADAVIAQGRDDLVGKIIAFDYPQGVVDYVAEGKLYGSVIQDPYKQGILGAETIAKYFAEGDANIEDNTYMELPIVSIENAADYPDAAW